MPKVFFLALNTHQFNFFLLLKRELPSNIEGEIISIKKLGFLRLFKVFPANSPGEAELEKIVAFSGKKLLARFEWLKYLNKYLNAVQKWRALSCFRFFTDYFQKNGGDLLIVWNGLALPLAAAVEAARRNGIKLLFCENGYLPDTIVMDEKGVNAANSLVGKTSQFYAGVEIDGEKCHRLFERQLPQRPLKKASAKTVGSLTKVESDLTLPENFIFLPLQVHDDSQVLLYSPRFPDMPSLISYCIEEVEKYNSRYRQRLYLVIKEHPSDFGRINYDRIKRQYPKALFVKAFATPELLRKCVAVLTINSTVGIEGLFNFKPVITLGDAFYNLPGLVYHLEEGEELAQKLNEALTAKLDQELIIKFLYYLRYHYLIEFEKRDLSRADPAPAVLKIQRVFNENEAL